MKTTIMTELEILTAALAVGFVKFSYYKKDGSHRIAIGTRNADLIKKLRGEHFESRARGYADHCVPYFDLSRGDFRCFIKRNFDHIEFEQLTEKQAVVHAVAIAKTFADISTNEYAGILDLCDRLVGVEFTDKVADSVHMNCQSFYDSDDQITEYERVVPIVEKAVSQTDRTYNHFVAVPSEQLRETSRRKELIAELMELRKRESEILAELLQ